MNVAMHMQAKNRGAWIQSRLGFCPQSGHGAVQADEDEHEMPQEPMEGQKQIGVHEAAGFSQGHDASQKCKILHEGANAFSVRQWGVCLNNGRIRHRYMGTLHSWKGKYHQLYRPWPATKYRKPCLYSSLTAKTRPQINSTPQG